MGGIQELGAFAGQYLMGAAIDLWEPLATGGYQPEAYQAVFGGILALQVLSLLWYGLAGSGRPGDHREETGV